MTDEGIKALFIALYYGLAAGWVVGGALKALLLLKERG